MRAKFSFKLLICQTRDKDFNPERALDESSYCISIVRYNTVDVNFFYRILPGINWKSAILACWSCV